MQKIKIDNWKWHLEDSALVTGWFKHWKELARKNPVKQNPVRVVFTVGDLFYVKVEQPVGHWRKLRSFLFPKAAREFAVGRALETSGVPVVKHLGWAQRKSENMLLTEAFSDSHSVLEYWFREIVYGSLEPDAFLAGFGEFLRTFFASGFYHPDFHLGNILYSPVTESFALVDVYGVTHPQRLSARQIAAHNNIFLELSRGLSDSAAIKFIMQVRNDMTLPEAREFWRQGMEKKIARAQKTWPKRRNQILDNYAKFVAVIRTPAGEFLVRKQPGPVPAAAVSAIPDSLNGNNFNVIHFPQREAEALWLESFRQELLGIDCLRPLVFEKPGLLYFEKLPAGAHIPTPDKAEEFRQRAENAQIEIPPDTLVQFPGGRIIAVYPLIKTAGKHNFPPA
ncbi:MAG: lipopolysaccharide kinase InaA family protein [Victivallales bacterium]|nr:lipopolysaccharide kinase InaA family protein [Victivallales bacterium]